MMEEFLEQITPWDEEVNDSPHHLFQKRIKTASFHIKSRGVKDLNKTTTTIARKIKTEQSGFNFHVHNNHARVITLDFKRQQINQSNLKQVLLGSKRQQLFQTKKKSIKALTKASIMQKLQNLKIIPPGPHNLVTPHKSRHQHKTPSHSHIRSGVRSPEHLHQKSKSLNVSKVNLQKPHPPEDHSFFNQIANLCRQKQKIVEIEGKKSIGAQMKIERNLFKNKNRKFKSWHKLNFKLTSSPQNNPLYATFF